MNSYLQTKTLGKTAALLFCGIMSLSSLTAAASPSGTPVAQSVERGTVKVSGLVLDENGEPIIGASVTESGTQRGTVTNVDGKFAISLAQSFNKYYAHTRILDDSPERDSRLALSYATAVVLNEALRLLGVQAPDEM